MYLLRKKERGAKLIDIILDELKFLGTFKFLSRCKGNYFVFKKFNKRIHDFIIKKDFCTKKDKILASVLNESNKTNLSEQVLEEINEIKNNKHDLRQLCSGHDFIAYLSVALQKLIGNNKISDVDPELLEKGLRLSCSFDTFTNSSVFEQIKNGKMMNVDF